MFYFPSFKRYFSSGPIVERRGRQFRFDGGGVMSVTADLGAFGASREITCQSKDKGYRIICIQADLILLKFD